VVHGQSLEAYAAKFRKSRTPGISFALFPDWVGFVLLLEFSESLVDFFDGLTVFQITVATPPIVGEAVLIQADLVAERAEFHGAVVVAGVSCQLVADTTVETSVATEAIVLFHGEV